MLPATQSPIHQDDFLSPSWFLQLLHKPYRKTIHIPYHPYTIQKEHIHIPLYHAEKPSIYHPCTIQKNHPENTVNVPSIYHPENNINLASIYHPEKPSIYHPQNQPSTIHLASIYHPEKKNIHTPSTYHPYTIQKKKKKHSYTIQKKPSIYHPQNHPSTIHLASIYHPEKKHIPSRNKKGHPSTIHIPSIYHPEKKKKHPCTIHMPSIYHPYTILKNHPSTTNKTVHLPST